MKTKLVLVCLCAVLVVAVVLITGPAVQAGDGGQGRQIVDLKGEKMRGDGEDPSIKQPEIKNDPARPAPDPREKTRGSYCRVVVYNYTGWYARIYVDGYCIGAVSPYGSSSGYFPFGGEVHVFQGRAPQVGISWASKVLTFDNYNRFTLR